MEEQLACWGASVAWRASSLPYSHAMPLSAELEPSTPRARTASGLPLGPGRTVDRAVGPLGTDSQSSVGRVHDPRVEGEQAQRIELPGPTGDLVRGGGAVMQPPRVRPCPAYGPATHSGPGLAAVQDQPSAQADDDDPGSRCEMVRGWPHGLSRASSSEPHGRQRGATNPRHPRRSKPSGRGRTAKAERDRARGSARPKGGGDTDREWTRGCCSAEGHRSGRIPGHGGLDHQHGERL